MQFHLKTAVGMTLALCTVSGAALAQSPSDRHDNNNDGQLSKEEFFGMAGDADLFADYDANRDSRLDENEWSAIGIRDNFDNWDLDGNDYLDDNEFTTGAWDWFDADDDNYLNDNEWNDLDNSGWFGE